MESLRRSPRIGRNTRWAIYLAVAAAVITGILLARPGGGIRIRGLSVRPDARPGPVPADGERAVQLVFSLSRPGYPVIFRVGPAPLDLMIWPESYGAELEPIPADSVLAYPSEGAEVRWLVPPAPAEVVFLVAASPEKQDLTRLREDAHVMVRGSAGLDDAATGLANLLEARIGPVARVSTAGGER